MRCRGRGEQDQGADGFSPGCRGRGLLDRAGELVELGDRLVELQALDRLANRGDGPMELSLEVQVLAIT